jgi:hypothetical protein
MAAEEIARTIGDQEWLDSVATPLQEALRKAFGSAGAAGREIKNKARRRQHPLPVAWIAVLPEGWRGARRTGHVSGTSLRPPRQGWRDRSPRPPAMS